MNLALIDNDTNIPSESLSKATASLNDEEELYGPFIKRGRVRLISFRVSLLRVER